MGLYNTIVDEQVKCFFVPANLLVGNEDGFKLQMNVSGGKLINYGIGSDVPWATPMYNYGSNFGILNYFVYDNTTQMILIENGRVKAVIPVGDVTAEQLETCDIIIDKDGEKLNIASVNDACQIAIDYDKYMNAYNARIKELQAERGLHDVYSAEFRSSMGTLHIDELKRIFAENEKVLDDAFEETMKLFYNKYYLRDEVDIIDNTGVGIVYAALTENYYSSDKKEIILKLFKSKEDFNDIMEQYLRWIETNPAVNKDEILKVFEMI